MNNTDNRTVIKQAALRLFAHKGYDGVGVQEIVQKCRLTKPTLYHYFGSKSGLFGAVLEEEFARFFGVMGKAFSYEHDIVQTLQTIAVNYLHFAENNGDFMTLQISMSFNPKETAGSDISAPFIEKFYKGLESLFEEAAGDHGNMKNRQTAYSISFIGILNAYYILSRRNGELISNETVLLAVHQFMHGIFS
ncbi:MAG: TetR/AcrR family transcriptional regulator [Spirochaetia bacterium]|nr:TetR/AcrR family transcriptional regulator [Spirochaetia bacterium]